MFELREGQQVKVKAAPKTKSGNPAAYQPGTVRFESSDPSVAKVVVDPNDELVATIVGINGSENTTVAISVTMDGDPDDDQERILVGSAAVTVTQGEAVLFDLELGSAEDVPEESGSSESEAAPAMPEDANPPSDLPGETSGADVTSIGSEDVGSVDELGLGDPASEAGTPPAGDPDRQV